MGTNYYARYNACECCGRYDEAHIGKSMRTVRAHDGKSDLVPFIGSGYEYTEVLRFADWRTILTLPGVTVWDEYGEQVITDLPAWLDRWTHYAGHEDWHCRDPYADTYRKHGDWLDPDGYHMCPHWFS
jgi:hypothetical protein